MLVLVSVAKGLIEVVVMLWLAQLAVALFSGRNRQHNPVYRMLAIALAPVRQGVRRVVGSRPSERLVSIYAGCLLVLGWFLLTWIKIRLARAGI